jgi:proteasome lid subunit RPN8/RPN11
MTRPVVHLRDHLRQEIIDHCLSELPNEGCGLLAMDGDLVMKVYPARNVEPSPTSYTVDPEEHYRALHDAESNGWRLGGVFHSHPNGPAEMSPTDLEKALDPDWVYVVVSLRGEPTIVVR